ncbi:virulence factor TspB C-terminal domain-related protein [Photobacterium sp. J15]|uniref:virulence factor TspB C-terminal domain-related protein n=1 Tax=Photobacterium sp. J15 TaxID=265901 RepID=UPI0007E2FEBB|nr:virulence factor TspB C-terminal domain-related protein [Photobacterium sp. J15]
MRYWLFFFLFIFSVDVFAWSSTGWTNTADESQQRLNKAIDKLANQYKGKDTNDYVVLHYAYVDGPDPGYFNRYRGIYDYDIKGGNNCPSGEIPDANGQCRKCPDGSYPVGDSGECYDYTPEPEPNPEEPEPNKNSCADKAGQYEGSVTSGPPGKGGSLVCGAGNCQVALRATGTCTGEAPNEECYYKGYFTGSQCGDETGSNPDPDPNEKPKPNPDPGGGDDTGGTGGEGGNGGIDNPENPEDPDKPKPGEPDEPEKPGEEGDGDKNVAKSVGEIERQIKKTNDLLASIDAKSGQSVGGETGGDPNGECSEADRKAGKCGSFLTFSECQNFDCAGDDQTCYLARREWEKNCDIINFLERQGKPDGLAGALNSFIADNPISDINAGAIDASSVMNKYRNGNGVKINGSCPAPDTTNVLGATFTIDYAPLCQLASIIHFFLVSFSLVGAGLLIAKFV